MRVIWTPVSDNRKTGPIPVTYASRATCPPCPLRGRGGCYAEGYPVRWHWDRVGVDGLQWRQLLYKIRRLRRGRLWRWGISGDLPGRGRAIDEDKLTDLVNANRHKRGFAYTHKPLLGGTRVDQANRHAIKDANRDGFTVNLSGDNLRHADQLASLGIAPVVVVLSKDKARRWTGRTPAGRTVITCPASYDETIQCIDCELCQWSARKVIIGFPAHGRRAGRVDQLARGE